MSDTTTVWDTALGVGDWNLIGAQLQSGDDLDTAVLISLFTDRVARPEDVIPDGTADPRGWWGDDPLYPIGSRLWLLYRAKKTQDTLAKAQDYVAEAVQWLIDDGVVAQFDITVEWTDPSQLGIWLVAYKSDGTQQSLNYSWAWAGIN